MCSILKQILKNKTLKLKKLERLLNQIKYNFKILINYKFQQPVININDSAEHEMEKYRKTKLLELEKKKLESKHEKENEKK